MAAQYRIGQLYKTNLTNPSNHTIFIEDSLPSLNKSKIFWICLGYAKIRIPSNGDEKVPTRSGALTTEIDNLGEPAPTIATGKRKG